MKKGICWLMLVALVVLMFPVVSEARCGGGGRGKGRLRNLIHRVVHPFQRGQRCG